MANSLRISPFVNDLIILDNDMYKQCSGSNIFLVAFSAMNFTCFITDTGLDLLVTDFSVVFTPIRILSYIDLAFTSLLKKRFRAFFFVLLSSSPGAESEEGEAAAEQCLPQDFSTPLFLCFEGTSTKSSSLVSC